jgi:cytochrome c oxidase subunit 2
MALAARVIAALALLMVGAELALAQEDIQGPFPWQMQFQAPATHVMDYVTWFSWYTVVIMTLIVLLVVGLIAYCVWKFNERANPVPSRVTHHTLIEVLWTVVPVLILVAIAIPSFRLLYGQYDPSKLYEGFDPAVTPYLNVKVTGVQWSWNVDYPNDEDSVRYGVAQPISFSMFPIPDDQIGEDQIRNLDVDNPIVVPIDTFVRVQTTGADVIHAFAVPAFGVKVDSVPGRLNETYFKAEREGIFYGQCSELCGKDHAFMPLAVRVVSQEQFRAWAETASADLPGAYQRLAESIEAKKNKATAAGPSVAPAQATPRS